ncbi:MAG TPA: hypothetical protein VEO95_03045 [Chthoniobacteraceae bacterium]|nr:hypothetical protein [Chthoniobacteraceae bacterium]
MKHLILAILVLATISLGACAHHETASSNYSTTSSTRGYSK